MKKILILLIIPLLMGGCYDYNELDDLAIVSAVGIDYKENNYEITMEVLSTKKTGETSGSTSAYTINSKGKTLSEAILNSGNNSDKVIYLDHIKIVIISEDIAKDHLKEISDYLIRTSKFRTEFYIAISKDATAKELINTTSKENPIASQFLVDLLEHNKDTSGSAYYAPFTKVLDSMITDGKDTMMPVFKKDNKKIKLEGLGVFKDFELKYIFDNESAGIINLLNNFNTRTVHFKNTCKNNKDKNTVISIYDSKIKIVPDNDKVTIKAKLNARINEENCDLDLKKIDTYSKLEKEFKKVIEREMDKTIDKLKLYESNALNIGKIYYNKYRKKDFFLWTKQDFKYDIDIKINKKGLTFEIED